MRQSDTLSIDSSRAECRVIHVFLGRCDLSIRVLVAILNECLNVASMGHEYVRNLVRCVVAIGLTCLIGEVDNALHHGFFGFGVARDHLRSERLVIDDIEVWVA